MCLICLHDMYVYIILYLYIYYCTAHMYVKYVCVKVVMSERFSERLCVGEWVSE